MVVDVSVAVVDKILWDKGLRNAREIILPLVQLLFVVLN